MMTMMRERERIMKIWHHRQTKDGIFLCGVKVIVIKDGISEQINCYILRAVDRRRIEKGGGGLNANVSFMAMIHRKNFRISIQRMKVIHVGLTGIVPLIVENSCFENGTNQFDLSI